MPEILLKSDCSDIEKIWTLMLYPEEVETSLDVATLLSVLESAEEGDMVDISVALRLANAPNREALLDRAIEATRAGSVAGEIACYLYLMRAYGYEPSMNKAIYLAEVYGKKATYGDGKKLYTSERPIRNQWRKYKNVAHLWGAWRMQRFHPYLAERLAPLSAEGFKDFLEVAKTIQDFLTSEGKPVTNGPVETFLDKSETHTLPQSVRARKFQPQSQNDWLVETLAGYKAPLPY